MYFVQGVTALFYYIATGPIEKLPFQSTVIELLFLQYLLQNEMMQKVIDSQTAFHKYIFSYIFSSPNRN